MEWMAVRAMAVLPQAILKDADIHQTCNGKTASLLDPLAAFHAPLCTLPFFGDSRQALIPLIPSVPPKSLSVDRHEIFVFGGQLASDHSNGVVIPLRWHSGCDHRDVCGRSRDVQEPESCHEPMVAATVAEAL